MLALRIICSAISLSVATGSTSASPETERMLVVDQAVDNISIGSLTSYAPVDLDADITAMRLDELDWFSIDGPALNYAPGKQRYIMRFNILNSSESEQLPFLHFNDSKFETATLWRYEAGRWQNLYQGGRGSAFSKRPKTYHRLVFPLILPKGSESKYLIDIKTTDMFKLHINLLGPAALADKKLKEILMHGISVGSLLAMALYNLILFVACRERDYLYYSLFTLGTLSMIAIFIGFPHQYLWPENPHYDNIALYLAISLVIVAGFLFVITFFDIRRVHLDLRNSMSLVYLTCLLLIVGIFGSLTWFLVVCGVMALLICSWGAAHGMKMIRQNRFMAGYFTFGWINFSIASLVALADTFALLPSNIWVYRYFEIAMVVTCMLLTFALGAKYAKKKEEHLKLELQLYQEQQEIDNSKILLESLFDIDTDIPYNMSFNIDKNGPLSEGVLSAFFIENVRIVLLYWVKCRSETGASAMLNSALAGVFRTSINSFDWTDKLHENLKEVRDQSFSILDRSCPGYCSSLAIAAINIDQKNMTYLCTGTPAIKLRGDGQDNEITANNLIETIDLVAYSHLKIGETPHGVEGAAPLMDLEIDLNTSSYFKAV